jgi:anti-sigma-K factor RskA
MWRIVLAASAALALCSAAAIAQQKGSAPPRSVASIECSKQADAKSLHGKARKKFRSKCMRDLRKKAA